MDIIKVLTTLPSADRNFLSALNSASLAQLKYAVQIMKLNEGGQNASRIKAIEKKIADFGKKPTEKKPKVSTKETTTAKASEPKKEEKPKELKVTPLDASKKPKIVPFKAKAEGNHTYEECEQKLKTELKKFTDNDSAYVVEGILERCKVDAEFRNNVMRKEKSYEKFFMFMFNAAKNGYCVKVGSVGGMLDANTALELALEYFYSEEEKTKTEANKSVTKGSKTEPKKDAEEKKKDAKERLLQQSFFSTGDDGQLSFSF